MLQVLLGQRGEGPTPDLMRLFCLLHHTTHYLNPHPDLCTLEQSEYEQHLHVLWGSSQLPLTANGL